MHFDIETPTVGAEVARLDQLGVHRLLAGAMEAHGNRCVTIAGPEGDEFCVWDAAQAAR
jgi:hypothetical protein